MEILQNKIKVILYDPNWNSKDISEYVSFLSLSGDLDSLSRKAEITLLDSKFNNNNVRCGPIDVGYFIHVVLDDEVALKGIIVDFSNSQDNIKVTVFDYMFYLNKSKITHNFSNTTAESGTKEILSELDVASGNVASTGIVINRLIKDKSASNAILELYHQAEVQTGKKYFLDMDDNKVSVKEIGSLLTPTEIAPGFNILNNSIELKKSIDGVINKIKIYDDKGNLIDTMCNKDLMYLGVLQDTIQKEKDKDYRIIASNSLKKNIIKYSLSLSCIGNMGYKSGYSAYVYIPELMIDDLLIITSDSHEFDLRTNTFISKLELTWGNQIHFDKADSDNEKYDSKIILPKKPKRQRVLKHRGVKQKIVKQKTLKPKTKKHKVRKKKRKLVYLPM